MTALLDTLTSLAGVTQIEDQAGNLNVFVCEKDKALVAVIPLDANFIGPSKSGKSQILAQTTETTTKVQTPKGPIHLTVLAYQTNKDLKRLEGE